MPTRVEAPHARRGRQQPTNTHYEYCLQASDVRHGRAFRRDTRAPSANQLQPIFQRHRTLEQFVRFVHAADGHILNVEPVLRHEQRNLAVRLCHVLGSGLLEHHGHDAHGQQHDRSDRFIGQPLDDAEHLRKFNLVTVGHNQRQHRGHRDGFGQCLHLERKHQLEFAERQSVHHVPLLDTVVDPALGFIERVRDGHAAVLDDDCRLHGRHFGIEPEHDHVHHD